MSDYELLKSRRITIMGVAALWIMLFHSTIQVPIRIVEIFCRLGYLGVDIFMFISGFSMRHSYDRSVDCKDFYLKRIKRIIPDLFPLQLSGGFIIFFLNMVALLVLSILFL